MPYIKQKNRELIEPHLNVISTFIKNGGDLNYCFTILCKNFIESFGENYSNHAVCISALENAKLEWYRRKVAPYEDKKITENGDV